MRRRREINEEIVSSEKPTKTPRIDEQHEVHEIPGQSQLSQGQPIPSSNGKIEASGISRISMDFEGDTGHSLKQSFIESIQSCPTDLDLICSDGVGFVHRSILMGVSKFFFRILHDRDPKDTEAITLVNVSIKHLLLALELIYSGDTMVKGNDEEGLHEVLNLFEIDMKLERKEATEEDVAMRTTLEQAEVTIINNDYQMQTTEAEEGTSGNEAETGKASKINVSSGDDNFAITATETVKDKETERGVAEANENQQVSRAAPYSQPQEMETGESNSEVDEESDYDSDNQVKVDKENDSLSSAEDDDDDEDNETGEEPSRSDDRSSQRGEDERDLVDLTPDDEEDEDNNRNRRTVAESRPGQFDLREPYPTEGDLTLNGQKIHWHLMEALPSLTSPELRTERMRVFTLNVVKRPHSSLRMELRNLFNSLAENSLEKRLGMMAVQCGDYEEIDLVDLVNSSRHVPAVKKDERRMVVDVELVGTPSEDAGLVRKIRFDEEKLASAPAVAIRNEMLGDGSARYNLANYEKIIYGNVPFEQERLLEIGNIKGLQSRAKALMKMNFAGRTVKFHRFMNPQFRWHREYFQLLGQPEIGGIGWGVFKGRSSLVLNLNGTQILFPMLANDVELAKKDLADQILKLNQDPRLFNCIYVAVSPKCLIENGIRCFPVVQTPGTLIYRHDNGDLTWTRGTSKLRLAMGAELDLT